MVSAFCYALNFLFKHISTLVACNADASAAFRCTLYLFAGRTLEVSVIFTVTVQPAAQRAVNVGSVPIQLKTHFCVVSGKHSVDGKYHQKASQQFDNAAGDEYVADRKDHAVCQKVTAELVKTVAADHHLRQSVS